MYQSEPSEAVSYYFGVTILFYMIFRCFLENVGVRGGPKVAHLPHHAHFSLFSSSLVNKSEALGEP